MLIHPEDGGGNIRSRISSAFLGDVSTRDFDLIPVAFLHQSISSMLRGCSLRLTGAQHVATNCIFHQKKKKRNLYTAIVYLYQVDII